MKKMIFGLVALACAWSGFAAEELNKGLPEIERQPLKFRVNQETGVIEDAPKSYLIQDFLAIVGDVQAGYGSLRDEAEEELREVNVALDLLRK